MTDLGEPEVPRNVRLRRPDGKMIAVEFIYVGIERDDDGRRKHTWVSTQRFPRFHYGWSVEIDEMPRESILRILT